MSSSSIKYKLLRIYFVTILLALFLAGLTFIVQDVYSIRQSTIQKLTIQSQIVASNASVAIFFEDQQSTTEILQSLKADREILAAYITIKQQPFADYHRTISITTQSNWLLTQSFIYSKATYYL